MKTTLVALALFVLASCQNTSKPTVNLNGLPKKWVQLTEQNGELVIYEPCDWSNVEIEFKDTAGKTLLLLEGYQDSMEGEVIETTQSGDTLLIVTQLPYGKDYIDTAKFIWKDKAKGLATWVDYFGATLTIVDAQYRSSYKQVEQPCTDCWDDCGGDGEDETAAHISNIQKVFDDYIKAEESIDSKEDKDLMLESIQNVESTTDTAHLQLLINVWMYYDPTDFSVREPVFRVLNDSRPQSVEAVKWRMANPHIWEKATNEPFAELPSLLQRLSGLQQ